MADTEYSALYRKPLGYRQNVSLVGLMTLKSFIDGGYEVQHAKILICVKSLGPIKKGRHLLSMEDIKLQLRPEQSKRILANKMRLPTL